MPRKYVGTYPVRKISRGELVIHLPEGLEGDYAIFIEENKDIHLIHMGVVKKDD